MQISLLKKKKYIRYPGYFVLNIDNEGIYNLKEKKNIYLIIGKLLGGFLSQNSNNDYLVEVKDKGKTLKNGARYHESNEAGNLHTDSPQWSRTPSIVGLYCNKAAIKGGESILVNSIGLLKESLKNKKIFENLFRKYHFDKRGDLKPRETNETNYANIFEYKNNLLRFRYLRDYIISGSKKMNYNLSLDEMRTLDFVDKYLNKSKNQIKIKLMAGDAIFFNNHIFAHGRTKFIDNKIKSKKRLYFRLWVK